MPGALERRLAEWGEGAEDVAPRFETARSATALVAAIESSEGAQRVRRLAAFSARTSETAVKRSLETTAAVLQALGNEARWLNFQTVRGLSSTASASARAGQLLDDLKVGLADDEVNRSLVAVLDELTSRAGQLIAAQQRPRPAAAGWKSWHETSVRVDGAERYAEKLRELAETLEREVRDRDPRGELRLEVSARILHREPGEA